jgi:hypothetical protein
MMVLRQLACEWVLRNKLDETERMFGEHRVIGAAQIFHFRKKPSEPTHQRILPSKVVARNIDKFPDATPLDADHV